MDKITQIVVTADADGDPILFALNENGEVWCRGWRSDKFAYEWIHIQPPPSWPALTEEE